MDEWASLRIPNTKIPIPVIIIPKNRMEVGPSAASESPTRSIIKLGKIINPKPKNKAVKVLKIKIYFNSILAIFVHHLNQQIYNTGVISTLTIITFKCLVIRKLLNVTRIEDFDKKEIKNRKKEKEMRKK